MFYQKKKAGKFYELKNNKKKLLLIFFRKLSPQAACLKVAKKDHDLLKTSFGRLLPGDVYSIHEQCKLLDKTMIGACVSSFAKLKCRQTICKKKNGECSTSNLFAALDGKIFHL